MTLMSGNIMLMPHGMCLVMQNLICVNVHIVKTPKHFSSTCTTFYNNASNCASKAHLITNNLFSFYEVYIKHHCFLKSIATNNLHVSFDKSIWLLPFPLFIVTMLFKFSNDHILITSILWNFEVTLHRHRVSIDSTSRLRLCGWLMHTPPHLNSALNVRGINRTDLAKQTSAEMQLYE